MTSDSIIRLDLGCGQQPAPGFTGVDLEPINSDVIVFDLFGGQVWPWEDESVDEMRASHVIEHIPADMVVPYKLGEDSDTPRQFAHRRCAGKRKDRLLFFFDEAYRIAKPGAQFTIAWPSLKSSDAFRDPTHRRFLPLEFTHYLSAIGRKTMKVDHYEVNCDWHVTRCELKPTDPKTQGMPAWSGSDLAGRWDAQCSFTCVLEKP